MLDDAASVSEDGALGAALALAGIAPDAPHPWITPAELASVRMTGPRSWWGGPLDVEGLALGSSRLAAASLARLLGRPGALSLRSERVVAGFDSLSHLRVEGVAEQGFAPLSRFWPTADGWLRTHANYPHHRAALLSALGLAGSRSGVPAAQGNGAPGPARTDAADVEDAARVQEVLRTLTSSEAEHRIVAAGGVAAAVRHRTGWEASAAGIAASSGAHGPLRWGLPWGAGQDAAFGAGAAQDPGSGRVAGSGARPSGQPAEPVSGPRWRPDALASSGRAPLAGLRVLDLTRVIAGPTATRTLAALGADVVRLDPPHLPELAQQHLDTDGGKRVFSLDLREQAQRVHALLADAHVLFTGYRPGALAAFGLDHAAVAQRHPHLVHANLSAWGSGPWEEHRGFDSIVQAATGIAQVYRDGNGHPGALPVQALDHATGQLLVAGVATLLHRRALHGSAGGAVSAALAHTAEALFALPRPAVSSGALCAEAEAEAEAGDGGVEQVTWEPAPGSGHPLLQTAPGALDLDGTPALPAAWLVDASSLGWNEHLAADTVSGPRLVE